MTGQPEKGARYLSELIVQALHQDLDSGGADRLDRLLVDDPSARRFYLEFMALQASMRRACGSILEENAGESPQAGQDTAFQEVVYQDMEDSAIRRAIMLADGEPEAGGEVRPLPAPGRCRLTGAQWRRIASNAAAIVLLCLTVLWLDRKLVHTPVLPLSSAAVMTDALNVRWGEGCPDYRVGEKIFPGELILETGCAVFCFRDGAEVVVESPAAFSLVAADRLDLSRGRAYARVGSQAMGFSIVTPSAKVIDLGTEFGVVVDRTGSSQVHMMKGKASVIAGQRGGERNNQMLQAGQACWVDRATGVVQTIAVETSAFVRGISGRSGLAWRGQALSLADMVGGGNGTGTGRRNTGLNPATGQPVVFDPDRLVLHYTTFSPAIGSPYIDSVFVPAGGEETAISTAGLAVRGLPKTDGKCYAPIIDQSETLYYGMGLATGSRSCPSILAGQSYGTASHPAIYMHANAGITFDLAAIRAMLGPDIAPAAFRSLCGVPDGLDKDADLGRANVDFWIAIDGQIRFQTRNMSPGAAPEEVRLDLTDTDRFLTLMVTDGGNGSAMDLALFATPVLEIRRAVDARMGRAGNVMSETDPVLCVRWPADECVLRYFSNRRQVMKNGTVVLWFGLLAGMLAVGLSRGQAAEVMNDGFETGKTFADNNWNTSGNVSWALSSSGYGNPANYAWAGGGATVKENLVSGTIAKDTGYVIQTNDLLSLRVDIRNMTTLVRGSSLLATLYYMDDGNKMTIGSHEFFEADFLGGVWTAGVEALAVKAPQAAVGKHLFISFSGGPNSWNGTSGQRMGIDNVIIKQDPSLVALNVSPAQGAVEVSVNSAIAWEGGRNPANPSAPAPAIQAVKVYLGTDPNLVLVATLPAGAERYQPIVPLATDTTYYWRVDTMVSDPNGSVALAGAVWSFSTTRTLAELQQPSDVYVFEGEPAAISLVASSQSAVSYAWYEGLPGDTSVAVGGNAPKLEFASVSLADEKSYWCRVTNSAGAVDSEAANLVVKRMLGWWPMDGDLANALGDGRDGTMTDPNFMAGIKGQALDLKADGRFVTVANSEQYYTNPSFTVTFFMQSGSTASLSALISKRATTPGQVGWFVYTQSGAASVEFEGFGILSGSNVLGSRWHMFTAQYDSLQQQYRLFVDGIQVAQNTGVPPFVHSGSPLIFGTASPISTSYYTGLLDDIRFYNYPLTAREIAGLYNEFTGETLCYASPRFDVTGPEGKSDCIVDLYDLAAFTAAWLECNIIPDGECR